MTTDTTTKSTWQPGDRVTVSSNGSALRGQVHEHLGDEIYLVMMPSGAVWRADGMWLKPRTVRNEENF